MLTHTHTHLAPLQVLPLLYIGALGDYSVVVGLVKADVPASWYITPVVRAIVNIQWASFAQVCACVLVRACVRVCVCMHVCMYVCMCMCVFNLKS